MEFGRYKECGPGIGGGFAAKYGIYFSRERKNYLYNKMIESNPEKRWKIIRSDLIKVLSNIRDANSIDEINDSYDSLKGMSMVIIKLAFCYFPKKVIGICGRKQLELILDLFQFEYNSNNSSLQLAFYFNDKLRKAIPEIYCNRPIKGTEKTCKDVGAMNRHKEKAGDIPGEKEYWRVYKRYKYKSDRKIISKSEFNQWNYMALELKQECAEGKITVDNMLQKIEVFENRKKVGKK